MRAAVLVAMLLAPSACRAKVCEYEDRHACDADPLCTWCSLSRQSALRHDVSCIPLVDARAKHIPGCDKAHFVPPRALAV